LGTGIFLI